jgi:hypothetical protein
MDREFFLRTPYFPLRGTSEQFEIVRDYQTLYQFPCIYMFIGERRLNGNYGVAYVGKTTNTARRISYHNRLANAREHRVTMVLVFPLVAYLPDLVEKHLCEVLHSPMNRRLVPKREPYVRHPELMRTRKTFERLPMYEYYREI